MSESKTYQDLIQSAIAESDVAANDFESCGEHTYGDVPNGLCNFQRAIGRAQVALLRGQIACIQSLAILTERTT